MSFDADLDRLLTRFVGRDWILELLDSWLEAPGASRVFWISGEPGAGKSALAAWLIRHRPDVVAYHLCRYGHAHKGDPRRIVLSLVHQLSLTIPGYAEALSALRLEELRDSDAQTLFDDLITQPFACDIPVVAEPRIVVIDALDEVSGEGTNNLPAVLGAAFGTTPEWLRLIVTSRPEPKVCYALQGLIPYVLDTSSAENQRDIKTYFAQELAALTESGTLPGGVLDALVLRSGGSFLYANWVREETAEGRLSLDDLEKLPAGLGGVYLSYFQRQFNNPDEYAKRVRPTLETVVASEEPLHIDFLTSLFDWSHYDRIDVKRSLGSLFPLTDDTIAPFHLSVLDWLVDENRAGPFVVSRAEGDSRLAEHGLNQYRLKSASLSAYELAFLPTHLCRCGREEEAFRLLMEFNFLRARAHRLGVQATIDGYELNRLGTSTLAQNQIQAIETIRGTLLLSADALSVNLSHLVGQLVGRLQGCPDHHIRAFLDTLMPFADDVRLLSINTPLAAPHDALVRTIETKNEWRGCVGIDARRDLSLVRGWPSGQGRHPRCADG